MKRTGRIIGEKYIPPPPVFFTETLFKPIKCKKHTSPTHIVLVGVLIEIIKELFIKSMHFTSDSINLIFHQSLFNLHKEQVSCC